MAPVAKSKAKANWPQRTVILLFALLTSANALRLVTDAVVSESIRSQLTRQTLQSVARWVGGGAASALVALPIGVLLQMLLTIWLLPLAAALCIDAPRSGADDAISTKSWLRIVSRLLPCVVGSTALVVVLATTSSAHPWLGTAALLGLALLLEVGIASSVAVLVATFSPRRWLRCSLCVTLLFVGRCLGQLHPTWLLPRVDLGTFLAGGVSERMLACLGALLWCGGLLRIARWWAGRASVVANVVEA